MNRFALLTFFSFLLPVASSQAATFTNTYDPLNRLTNAAYSDGSRESYSYDKSGNRIARITTVATTNIDNVSPSVPTNIGAPNISSNQIALFWTRSSDTGGAGMAGYYVYVNGALAGNTTGTNFLLTGLVPGTTYCVRLAAYDRSSNVTTQTPEVCFTTLGGFPIVNGATQVVAFADNFDDNSINSRLWTNWLNTVTESNLVMNVDTTVTDQGGNLRSRPIVVDPATTITISRKVFLHRQTWSPTVYMAGFVIAIDGVGNFGVKYCDINWNATIGGTTYLQRHGIYLIRNGANPHIQAYSGDVSSPVPAIWDTWFDERITYDPTSGMLSYYTNNALALQYSVGALPTNNITPTLTMQFDAWGWWTGHQQHMDNFVLAQNVGGWWFADMSALGFTGPSFQLQFATAAGKKYLLEATDNLTPPFMWTPVTLSPILGTGQKTNITDSGPFTSSRRFYRLRMLQ